jgi:hypothetical protein
MVVIDFLSMDRASTRFSSITDLKSPSALALDNYFAMQRAKFDLANMAASGIDLLRDQDRTLQTSASLALRGVAASVNADGCRRWIEVGLEHRLASCRASPIAGPWC